MSRLWPHGDWDAADIPASLRPKALDIKAEATRIGSYALFAAVGGRSVLQHGSFDTAVGMQSVRKALMSALIGRAVASGQLNISDTMEELGIDDDDPSLTAQEKQATVRHCLMGRSGVYHKAAYEPLGQESRRPARNSHLPGEHWFYNNWDFNVLATILRQATGEDTFSAFNKWFAEPMAMQDFDPGRCTFFTEPGSTHPAYLFSMSARDLARMGVLYLAQGQWGNKQLLPAPWIAESLEPLSEVSDGYEAFTTAFGYLWWIGRSDILGGYNNYAALGGSGHCLIIIPDLDAVIVHRNNDEATTPDWTDILPMIAATVELCRSVGTG